jgi:spore coat protein U-like protein
MRVAAAALACSLLALPFGVRADQCFVTSNGLAFGTYDLLSPTDLPGAGSIVVTCNQDRSVVQLTLSAGSSGSSLNRVMRNAARDALAYNVYTDAARTAVWTDATTVTFTPGRSIPYTVNTYGKIFAGQDVGAGAYGDSIGVNINF